MPRPSWVTEAAYASLYRLENSIHVLMTEKLGYTECVEEDHHMRLWNFLDYLEETYVTPTFQGPSQNVSRNRGSGTGGLVADVSEGNE